MTTTAADSQGNPTVIEAPTGAIFIITDATLYVPVVTLSTDDDNKLLEQLKKGFQRKIKLKKIQIRNQAKTANLSYLIDPAFSNINRLFALSFQN